MIVKSTWIRTITIVALASTISGNVMLENAMTTESSGEYLRKVMLELRDMNLPPSTTDRTTGSFYFDVDDRNFLAGKRHSSRKRIVQQLPTSHEKSVLQAPMIQTIAKKIEPVTVDQIVSETTSNNHYYQLPEAASILPAPQKVIAPDVPTITRSQLNAIYKHAYEKGNAVSLNALANVLRHRQLTTATPNNLGIGDSQPMYTYYFYPAKSFMNGVHEGNSLLPVMNLQPEHNPLTEASQKDMSNPLFMAISGFVGMAVLFMIGVLLIPRLGDFNSRVASNEKFLDLTQTVGEAIDRQNCTDQFSLSSLNGKLGVPCQSVNIPAPKPSSVVLLTRKSMLRKDAATRRRKIARKCKVPPCKKSVYQ